MKRYISLVFILALIILTGCSSDTENGIKVPSSSSDYKGQNYEEVISDIEGAGFTNVNVAILDDLITGWMTKDGEVEAVSVDGDTEYNANARYSNDVEIVVTYHTFPEATDTSEETTDTSEESEDPDIQEDSKEDDAEEILTVSNCEDLVVLLSTRGDVDPKFSEFAEKYKGRIVEFDACITYIVNHDDYDTRYDLLLDGGDYIDDDTDNPGPTFKFGNVNNYDMGIDAIFLPDFVSLRSNVRIQAMVVDFNADTGIFRLDPVKVEER